MSDSFPHGMPPAEPRKSSTLIRVGGILTGIAVLGILGCVIIVSVSAVQDLGEKMYVLPGAVDWEVPEAGSYEIYYLHYAIVNGKTYRTSEIPPDLVVTVSDPVTGEDLFLEEAFLGIDTFESGDGTELYYVDFPKAGTYTLDVQRPESVSEDEPVVIGVKGTPSDVLSVGFLGSCCMVPVFGIPGIVILIVAFVRRSQSPPSPMAWNGPSDHQL